MKTQKMITIGFVTTILLIGFVGVAENDTVQNRTARKNRRQLQENDDSVSKADREAIQATMRGKKEEAESKRDAAKDEMKRKKDDAMEKMDRAKQKWEEKKSKERGASEEKRGEWIDRRQNNQEKRIQHGINKGFLTDDEVAKLTEQQQKLAELESSYRSDGKLTKDECETLRNEIKKASANIWAEKHDKEGNQMPIYRLGVNVFPKDSLTNKFSGEISGKEAKKITADFRQMISLKKKLSGDLNDEDRTKLQSEYDNLMDTYFDAR